MTHLPCPQATPADNIGDKRQQHPSRYLLGLTLIELLVVLTIIGITSAVALPAYQDHVQRSHRAQARAALVRVALWMERAATAQGSYPLSDGHVNEIPATVLALEGGRYTLTAMSHNGSTFLLIASPTAHQASDPCGAFQLDHTGKRSQTATAATPTPLSPQDCWSR